MSESIESVNKKELPYTEDKEIIEQIINDAIAYFTECKKYKMHFENNRPINAEKQSIDFIKQNELFQLYQKYLDNRKKYININLCCNSIAILNSKNQHHSFYNLPSYIYMNVILYSIGKTFYIHGVVANIYGPSRIIDEKEANGINDNYTETAIYIREEVNKLQLQIIEKNNIIEKLNNEINELKHNIPSLSKTTNDKEEPQNKIDEELKFIDIKTYFIDYKLYYDNRNQVKYLSYTKEDKEYKNDICVPSSYSANQDGLFSGRFYTKNSVCLVLHDNKLNDGNMIAAVRHENNDVERWRNGIRYGVIEFSKIQ